ncbi:MAG: HAMP domain-containing histidine kinase, partial [Chitinivibrionales bacterium]|nr:HAMP domain-containing histidine kinase [Chitinivibrionales bacterium]
KRERLYTMGQLAMGVAHDFNNLLIPIMNYVDIMLDNADEIDNKDNVRHNLVVIQNAVMHGREIVGRMQQFYHTVKIQEKKEPVDTKAIIGEVMQLSKSRLGKGASEGNPVEIVLNLDSDCIITGRRAQIHEMLLNLVLNAADAMPHGGCLEVSTKNSDGSVTIIVKDTGEGMTEEIRQKCLQPFFTTKAEKGTGMGLTMVNNIVIEHGGRLEINSTLGAGTSFVLTFPSAPDDSLSDRDQMSREKNE